MFKTRLALGSVKLFLNIYKPQARKTSLTRKANTSIQTQTSMKQIEFKVYVINKAYDLQSTNLSILQAKLGY